MAVVTRTVEQLLAREVGEDWTPIYVYGSTPAYFHDGTETPREQVLLHERAIAVQANAEREEQRRVEAERLAALPPDRQWMEQAFLRVHERLDAIDAALATVTQ